MVQVIVLELEIAPLPPCTDSDAALKFAEELDVIDTLCCGSSFAEKVMAVPAKMSELPFHVA